MHAFNINFTFQEEIIPSTFNRYRTINYSKYKELAGGSNYFVEEFYHCVKCINVYIYIYILK